MHYVIHYSITLLTLYAPEPTLRAPEPFKGKDSILSWTTHMNNYLASTSDEEALAIAISYLHGPAHEWWIAFKETEDGRNVTAWGTLKEALIARFETLNKENIARE